MAHKISSAFWTCRLCEKIGVIDEAQERISKLYVWLEEMNKNIEMEQTRRRQVMQRMDKMGAGEGREDIDYTLASAFDRGGPTWKKVIRRCKVQYRMRQQGGQMMQPEMQSSQDQTESSTYRPPAIGGGGGETKGENPEAEVPPLHGRRETTSVICKWFLILTKHAFKGALRVLSLVPIDKYSLLNCLRLMEYVNIITQVNPMRLKFCGEKHLKGRELGCNRCCRYHG